jgi:RNA polymerase sigma factor (sigma-70 family)
MIDAGAHVGLARSIAYRYRRTVVHCSRAVEPADLVGAAIVGLVEAAERYRPTDGPFARFATPRIRGAVLDAVRRERGRSSSSSRWTIALDSPRLSARESARIRDELRADPSDPPDLARRDLRKLLRAARAILPPAELLVLEGVARGEDLQTIGRALRVTESRVSQLKAAAIRRIRECLKP